MSQKSEPKVSQKVVPKKWSLKKKKKSDSKLIKKFPQSDPLKPPKSDPIWHRFRSWTPLLSTDCVLRIRYSVQLVKVGRQRRTEVGGESRLFPPLDNLGYFHQFFSICSKNWTPYTSGSFLSKSGMIFPPRDFFGPSGSYLEAWWCKSDQTLL